MNIPLNTNTSVETAEMLNKYKDLEIEDERMWGSKQQQFRWLWEPFSGMLGHRPPYNVHNLAKWHLKRTVLISRHETWPAVLARWS